MANYTLEREIPEKAREWRRLATAIEADKKRLDARELQAFYGLRDYWKYNGYERGSKLDEMLDVLRGSRLCRGDGQGWRDLWAFVQIGFTYYAKNYGLYAAFQQTMRATEPSTDNVLADMAWEKVREWRRLVEAVEAKRGELRQGEDAAYYGLRDYWQHNGFDAARCRAMLAELKRHANFHPGGWEDLLLFQRICVDYYTRDAEAYAAFQRAMWSAVMVCRKSYGTDVMLSGKTMVQQMILAGTPLDDNCRAEEEYLTVVEDQRTIQFSIYESNIANERIIEEDYATLLDDLTCTLPAGLPKGTKIKLIMEVDNTDKLHVEVEADGQTMSWMF